LTRSSIILQDFSHLFVRSKFSNHTPSSHPPFTIAQVVDCFNLSIAAAAKKLAWPPESFRQMVVKMGIPHWPVKKRRVAQARKTGVNADGKRRCASSLREDQFRQYMPTFKRPSPASQLNRTTADKHAQMVAWVTGGSQTDPAPTVSMLDDPYGVFLEAQTKEILNLNPELLAEMRIMDEVYEELIAQGGVPWV